MIASVGLLAACGGGNVSEDQRRLPLAVTTQAAPVYDRDDLYRFFSIAFGAAPGVTYMGQLVEAADYGLSIKQIVNIFTTKPQFLETYPATLSNREYAQKLVDNVVGTSASAAAKAEAVEDIVAALSVPGWTRGDITYAIFNNLAKKAVDDIKWGGTARKMANQVVYAKHFTEVMKSDSTDLNHLRTAIYWISEKSSIIGDLTSKLNELFSQGTIIRKTGTITGLSNGNQIIIENSIGGQIKISRNGEFEFYKVSIESPLNSLKIIEQPIGQLCRNDVNSEPIPTAINSEDIIICKNIGITNKFNTKGISARSIAIDSDGSIFAASSAVNSTGDQDVAIVKYNSSGELNRTFGNDGIVITNISGRVASTDWVRGVTIQRDGKILVVGYTQRAGAQETGLSLLRYHTDGSLDRNFGNSGIVTSYGGNKDKRGHALAVQADGKIVVGGSINCTNRSTPGYCSLIERYNIDGSPDLTFKNSSDTNTRGIAGLTIQSDGKILTTGSIEIDGAEELSVARYTEAGLPDQSFGINGLTTVVIGTEVGSQNGGIDIAIDKDGGIIVTGWAYSRVANSHISLTKLLPNGEVDRKFGKQGSVVTYVATPPESDFSNAIAIQEDGKIIVAGEAIFARKNTLPYPGFYTQINVDMAVVRYDQMGRLDHSFGVNGVFTLDINFLDDRCNDVALDATGRIVLGGSTYVYDPLNIAGGETHMSIVRLMPNGSVDTSFTSSR
jgi:uncharacterized delta-60 repeat protein